MTTTNAPAGIDLDLDNLEALARKAYLANEVVAMIPPAKILHLIAQARADQPKGATGTTGGSLTLQQLADRISDQGVMSPAEFRHFLNGDGVEMYPHQLLRMANLLAAAPVAAVAPSDAKDATVPSHSEREAAHAGELPSCQFCGGTKGHWKGCCAPEDANVGDLAIELQGVREEMAAGSGFWSSCSGCYDTEDGHPTGNYSYSAVFGCALGSGCSECGGIGAVWDNTDYEATAKDWDKADQSPATIAAGQEAATVDRHLDAVLRASGSALRHYCMPKTLDDMRAAMRVAMAAVGAAGKEGGK